MDLALEAWEDVQPEIAELCKLHWEEIALDKDIPLAPDWDTYQALAGAGSLRAFTVRDKDGALVGYAIFIINRALHYRDSVQAIQDVIFLHPDHRRGRAGMHLIAMSEDHLRAEGVQVLSHHVKQAHPALGRVLERMGYGVSDILYKKRLDK